MVNLKKIKISTKGFSLIELLISISIIGILGSIILTSVSGSRAKAFDSKIRQQLNSFRTASEIYFSAHDNSYGPASSSCGGVTNTTLFNNLQSSSGNPGVYIAAGNLPDFASLDCEANDTDYTVKVSLFSGNQYWCIDGRGNSRMVSGVLNAGDSDTVCP
jgi:prepilin-type N-terminal cleavage/methylation domain-containing protein